MKKFVEIFNSDDEIVLINLEAIVSIVPAGKEYFTIYFNNFEIKITEDTYINLRCIMEEVGTLCI